MRATRVLRLGIVLGGLVSMAGAGCATTRDAAPPPAKPDPRGEWRVVGHRLPGVSALTDADAAVRHGTVLRFGERRAVADVDTCRHVCYQTRFGRCDSLLATNYRVSAEALGLAPADGRLAVTRVFCGDQPWASLGGVLLWIDADHAYSPWDGAFFELQRGADEGTAH